jgi:hypothetical protein
MKNSFTLFFALGIITAHAESTGPSEPMEAKTERRIEATPLTLEESKPNEIKTGSISYSGAAVELIKFKNPFQLINPFAPAQYGWAEDNVVLEPMSSEAPGIKIFSIQF